jgi:hypothetical protein
MLPFVMADTPTSSAPAPATSIRLDPSPSKVFSWLEWSESPEPVLDDRGRTIQPAGPVLTVRYRYNGAEHTFWPVSENEARQVMNPGPAYDYSIGKAFGSLIKAHKSGRLVRSGDRQETTRQREEIERREGRRWLA